MSNFTFRKMMAVTTPQGVANNCLTALEFTTSRRRESAIEGGVTDHIGFCVEPAAYDELKDDFAAGLIASTQVSLTDGGRAVVGLQQSCGDGLCLYHRHAFPGVALVTADALKDLNGGAYVVVVVPSLAYGIRQLELQQLAYSSAELYGQPAFVIELDTPSYGPGPGLYRLYVMAADLWDASAHLRSQVQVLSG